MKRSGLAVLLTALVSPLLAQETALVKARDVQWGEHPFVKGAKLAVQSGDPGKGPSVLLMKFPKGMTIPAHTHTSDEVVTIVSGSGVFGGGESVEAAKGTTLGRGSYIAIPGRQPHWAIVQEELVFTVTLNQAADFHLCGGK